MTTAICTQTTFASQGPFWREHNYHNPATGYFSYLHSLKGEADSALDQIIRRIHATVVLTRPEAKQAKFAEVRCAPLSSKINCK